MKINPNQERPSIYDSGLPSATIIPCHCDYCGKDWDRPASYVVYKADFIETGHNVPKEFCSFNCRSKYYAEHKNERTRYLEQLNYKKTWEYELELREKDRIRKKAKKQGGK